MSCHSREQPSADSGAAGPGASAPERSARNQVVFREVNERIAELAGHASEVSVSMFICECSDSGCAESLRITPHEYEDVRAHGARFVVVAGHQLPGLERVVDGTSRFLVVEKIGAAGSIARESDPRREARAPRRQEPRPAAHAGGRRA